MLFEEREDVVAGGATPSPQAAASRWELYRLLADPVRPRLLALVSLEELGVGELAELLREGPPKVSRHASALREAGLLSARRQGTWTLLRLSPEVAADAVVADAVRAGLVACEADGTRARVDEVIRARDASARAFFARGGRSAKPGPPDELPSYLAALAPLIPDRAIAIDVGTGDGALLEVLAPLFDHVIGLDRSDAQIELAKERVDRRQFDNVELVCGEIGGPEVKAALRRAEKRAGRGAGADVVFASRVLHHAAVPEKALCDLALLARAPYEGAHGGAVLVLDYEAHEDQALRSQEADLWLGFERDEMLRLAEAAALTDVTLTPLPASWRGEGPDRHLAWQLLAGRRGAPLARATTRGTKKP